MQYQTVISLVQSIIDGVQNSAISINRSLAKTLSVKVTNPVKKVEVKGQVIVSNLKNLDKPLKQLKDATLAVKSSVDSIPTEITVKNFPKTIEVSNHPDNSPKIVTAIEKLGEKVQGLHKPISDKTVEVSNQPTKELKDIEKAVFGLSQLLAKVKLDPKITVQAPKPDRLVVPPANVTVEKTEIDYLKLAKSIGDQIPEIDYKKLASVLSKEMSGMVITGGGGGGTSAYSDSSGRRSQALVDEDRHAQVDIVTMPAMDVDTSLLALESTQQDLLSLLTDILAQLEEVAPKYETHDVTSNATYQFIGKALPSGAWEIKRTTIADNTMRFIRGASNYTTNWTNRESLSYDYIFNLW